LKAEKAQVPAQDIVLKIGEAAAPGTGDIGVQNYA
jgi:hypothetical protein